MPVVGIEAKLFDFRTLFAIKQDDLHRNGKLGVPEWKNKAGPGDQLPQKWLAFRPEKNAHN